MYVSNLQGAEIMRLDVQTKSKTMKRSKSVLNLVVRPKDEH